MTSTTASATHESAAEHTAEAFGEDAWLDVAVHEPTNRRRDRLRARTTRAISRVKTVYDFLNTTPGKMAMITLLLSVAIAAAGYSMSQSSAQRKEGLDTLLSETEPLSYAAHDLYTNLSLADTIATSGFVRTGLESQQEQERYFSALDRASVAATQSASGITPEQPRIGELVTEIQRQLPIYTAMVETARTNSRQGNPVGVTYTSNASALMRNEILPAAAELFTLTNQRVAEQQKELTTPQWVPLSGLFAAVGFLLLAQWWLWRTTRRRLNRGFVAATALMVLAIIWVSTSNIAAWQAGGRGFKEASQPWDSLTTARIEAQQAQTSEMLALVTRESADQTSASFDAMNASVSQALGDVELALESENSWPLISAPDVTFSEETQTQIDNARRSLDDWSQAQNRFLDTLRAGRFDEAAYLSTNTSLSQDASPTTASAAARLDSSLSALINDARASMRTFIAQSLAATTLVSTAVLLLALAAVISVWIGIRARLQEYL
ncbi:hypothetical protein [Corynebacterium tapiri]|uniref:Chemotaxis methyl-accepting receptor HlyB-like 4HB MCP domain-containing protein n=1 Tax=Corynebacterium tapiri TaxID=1448266 RepID=A0A5C4U3K0_9CORY|nr:hypothetical protein [Corynebacterium tapiri]TNL95748.1 hypothetical protein FHE74_09145 [Corynebacterium tapiri]